MLPHRGFIAVGQTPRSGVSAVEPAPEPRARQQALFDQTDTSLRSADGPLERPLIGPAEAVIISLVASVGVTVSLRTDDFRQHATVE